MNFAIILHKNVQMGQYNIKVEIIRICCDLMLQSVMFHVSLQSLFAQICCKMSKNSETSVFKVTQNQPKYMINLFSGLAT